MTQRLPGPGNATGPIARVLAWIGAVAATVVFLVAGLFAGIVMLGLIAIVGAAVAFRLWRLRRALQAAVDRDRARFRADEAGGEVIEGEFSVVDRQTDERM